MTTLRRSPAFRGALPCAAPLAALALAAAPAACTVDAVAPDSVDASGGFPGPDAAPGNGNGNGGNGNGDNGNGDNGNGDNGNGNGNGNGAAACTPSGDELLENGGFDDAGESLAPWETDGLVARFTVFQHTEPNAVAILFPNGNGTGTLEQQVTVPTGTTQLELQFFECFVDQGVEGEPDELSIDIVDPQTGAVLDHLDSFLSTDGKDTCSFEPVNASASNPSSYAGQDVVLQFFGETIGGNDNSTFYLDTVSLRASCP